MIRSFLAWWRAHKGDVSTLDHVPVIQSDDSKAVYTRKRAEAKAKHGRDFHTDEIKEREQPKSRDLLDFDEASERAKNDALLNKISNVRAMTRGGK